ncbi:C4-dicarboxylate ABC transporter substrate-binding protein [Actinophytocola xinjiangensis]|uniref:C4-dicarboxylate ABC transporter substrate-binding protein n=1 Tax=Actinophytocola xinjiangensis TaxID=485602 RepID=A0A7Z0WKN2_9PSEU|nr:TAXI family TRAP transporter solute-binding subunit [Actinophytocola xinjiangensis]OLF09566.1 C4-dicarboxylate ABC transporter substrate-binding protein [Actinophytocola xinjiangensis]
MRSTRIVAGALAVALVAAGCGGKQEREAGGGDTGACEASSGRITIATGNTGGVYYTLGGGLAQLISDNTELNAGAAETGASVQNIQQLVSGDYDIAFSLADTAADAVNGTGSFEGQKQDIAALARIYSNYTQVVVRADAGITSIADMRGKKISTGSPKSGTEVIAHRLLEAAGLDPAADVSAQRLALRPTVDQMKAGQIDGLFWSGGLPTPEITDLTTSLGEDVTFLDITDLLPELKRINPVYDEGTLTADTYKLPADVSTVVVPNMLLVRSDFADNDACAITSLIFDKKDELVKVHKAAAELDAAKAVETDPVPLHPGAEQALNTD